MTDLPGSNPRVPGPNPDVTAPLAGAPPARREVGRGELVRWMNAQLQLCDGCGNVTVVGITRLDGHGDGCNWSRAVVVEPHGTPPQVYARRCAAIVERARQLFNLKSGSGTDS